MMSSWPRKLMILIPISIALLSGMSLHAAKGKKTAKDATQPKDTITAPKKGKAKKQGKNQAQVEEKVECPKKIPKIPKMKRKDVYKGTPYQPGERADYEVRYMGALAGIATMEVKRPYKFKGHYKKPVWHRSYHVEANTGDWYRWIFVAKDRVDALIRPWDFGISKFYIKQDEGKLFGRRLRQEKWLEFSHEKCRVSVRVKKVGKKEKNEEFDLAFGAMDTLGVAYWLREQNLKVGKKHRTLIYSSEKNWWLEATSTKEETIKVKGGKFKAMKINLQTYIGAELQQKGDVDIWIATDTKERQLLQIKGEIKIGSVYIELAKYVAGK